MKRLYIVFVLMLFGFSLHAQEALVESGHSLSLSIAGFEYGYEQAIGGSWSVVFRAGMPSVLVDYEKTTSSESGSYNVTFSGRFDMRPAITVEPRFYTNMARRKERGFSTVNNRANFLSVRVIANTPDYESVCVTAIPMFGLRRGSSHWFREYTFGLAYHSYGAMVLPHINFRIGYTF